MFLQELLRSGPTLGPYTITRETVNLNHSSYLCKAAEAQHFEDGELKRRESFGNLLSFIPICLLFPFFVPSVCMEERAGK